MLGKRGKTQQRGGKALGQHRGSPPWAWLVLSPAGAGWGPERHWWQQGMGLLWPQISCRVPSPAASHPTTCVLVRSPPVPLEESLGGEPDWDKLLASVRREVSLFCKWGRFTCSDFPAWFEGSRSSAEHFCYFKTNCLHFSAFSSQLPLERGATAHTNGWLGSLHQKPHCTQPAAPAGAQGAWGAAASPLEVSPKMWAGSFGRARDTLAAGRRWMIYLRKPARGQLKAMSRGWPDQSQVEFTDVNRTRFYLCLRLCQITQLKGSEDF